MKYALPVTATLAGLFLLAQVAGLAILYQDIQVVLPPQGGPPQVVHPDTPLGDRPETEGGDSVLLMLTGVLVGTALLLLIIKIGKAYFWTALFFVAVLSTTTIALGVFLGPAAALGGGLVLALLKVFKPHPLVHNLTEIFIYAGIAVLFVPLFDLFWVTILLLAIAAYDAFAVWQSKHMITLAEFQTDSGLFAGLSVGTGEPPRKGSKAKRPSRAPKRPSRAGTAQARTPSLSAPDGPSQAILGGGDIAFPLIFAGVVLEMLIQEGVAKPLALLQTLAIPVILTLVVVGILVKGKQGHFYPAMPFLTGGCLLGYALIWGLGIVG